MTMNIPSICDDTISRVNDNNTVILMKADDSDVFFKIHGIAASVWKEVISEKKDLATFVKSISTKFDVEEKKVYDDIESFFKTLKNKELISY